MYALSQARFRELVHSLSLQLQDMAIDSRAFPGVATEVRQLRSSASTPSLRSRESELVPMGRTTPDNGGGNVRVVVRVRGFLPRGLSPPISISSPQYSIVSQKSNEEHNV